MYKIISKTLLVASITLLSNYSYSQVGIGTTTPNADALLEINSTVANPGGVLLPRMALTMTTSPAPLSADVAGMIVYNTATAGDVTPGFYYNDGAIWIRLGAGTASADWSILGNTGTVAGTNFIGTTDAQDLQLRTNGAQRISIGATNGNVAIGTATIPATIRLQVDGGAGDGIFGHSDNVGGYLGRETNISFGTPIQTLSGAGVYANNPSSGYTSVYAQSTGSADVAANIAYSDVWMASYNYVQNGSNTYNPSASYNQLNVTNGSLAGTQIALRGFNNRGTTNSNPGYTVGAQGVAVSRNQDSYGVGGSAYSNANISMGGYFTGNTYAGTNYAYSYVGGTVNGATARKIIGSGSVSEIVPTENHGRVTLTCPESPEYWYQDYGTVEMTNGKATIVLDDILSDIIIVDNENPIRVICTPVGMPYFNGVTIMSQTKNSVEILELNGGNHSGKLQYQLVVKPKTNYGEGRFPQAPGPGYLKSDKEPRMAKAKNQPNDGRKIFRWPADHDVYKYNPEEYINVGDIVPAGPNSGKFKLRNGKYSTSMPVKNPDKNN